MSDDERAVRKVVDDWMAATRAGDKDAILALVSDDILFLTPFGPPFGKKEFGGAPDNSDMPKIEGTNEILEMEVVGDLAWTRNQVDIQITPAGENTTSTMSGQTLTLFRKEADGNWRLFRDANFVKPAE